MAKFSKINLICSLKRLLAVAMVFAMVALAGCGDEKAASKDKGKNNSSANNTSGAEIDALQGEISHTIEVDSLQVREDADEIAPETGVSNLKDKREGILENEAAKLRDQILNTDNTEKYYKIKGKKYYVSPGGNDANDGTSPENAIRSIDALMSLPVTEGDAVLFERNSIFRTTQTIRCAQGVIYGSYGTGDKPKIYGSGKNFAKAEWSPTQRKNIWRTNYIYDKAGCIIFDLGEEIGYMRQSIRNLNSNMQFYQSEEDGFVYLYCDKGNPATVYESIEISAGVNLFTIPGWSGDVVIDNICLMYGGAHGIAGTTQSKNVTVTNCEIGYIGGYKRSTHRLGNAIQMWAGVDGFTVKNNWIYQTFDTAITWQGSRGAEGTYTDINIEGNLLEYNHTDIEFWDKGTGKSKLGDFNIENNMFRFTQLGWGARANDGGLRGFDGVIYGTTSNLNITGRIGFKNNIIDSPGGQLIKWTTELEQYKEKWDIYGTKVYVKNDCRFEKSFISGVMMPDGNSLNFDAKNQTEAENCLKYFDPTVQVVWK